MYVQTNTYVICKMFYVSDVLLYEEEYSTIEETHLNRNENMRECIY